MTFSPEEKTELAVWVAKFLDAWPAFNERTVIKWAFLPDTFFLVLEEMERRKYKHWHTETNWKFFKLLNKEDHHFHIGMGDNVDLKTACYLAAREAEGGKK